MGVKQGHGQQFKTRIHASSESGWIAAFLLFTMFCHRCGCRLEESGRRSRAATQMRSSPVGNGRAIQETKQSAFGCIRRLTHSTMVYDPHIDVVQILAATHSLLENAKFPANDSEALTNLKKAIKDAIAEIQLATPAIAMTEKHQA